MRPLLRSTLSSLAAVLVLSQPLFSFDSPLSQEAVREAYFLGQRNDRSTMDFFSGYLRTLPPPNKGPYISEIEIYTPFAQIIEASRRRSMGYSAQQAEIDYRHSHDKIYIRIRIDFTETYGALELYRSAKGDKEISNTDQALPDFYRDFHVGLSQLSGPTHEDRWIEPLRIILQPAYVQSAHHYPFIPADLGIFSYAAGVDSSSYGYDAGNGYIYPTGWLAWLVYDANDIASDDATVHVVTTDGQNVEVPFDFSRLR